jgi:hypothetical protein
MGGGIAFAEIGLGLHDPGRPGARAAPDEDLAQQETRGLRRRLGQAR